MRELLEEIGVVLKQQSKNFWTIEDDSSYYDLDLEGDDLVVVHIVRSKGWYHVLQGWKSLGYSTSLERVVEQTLGRAMSDFHERIASKYGVAEL